MARRDGSVSEETASRAYPVEVEAALTAWIAENDRQGVWVSPAGWWYAGWKHGRAELEAAQAEVKRLTRLIENKYVPWTNAGGPNECEHGYATGIPCRRCDEAVAVAIAHGAQRGCLCLYAIAQVDGQPTVHDPRCEQAAQQEPLDERSRMPAQSP
jgi:hypothetical protein